MNQELHRLRNEFLFDLASFQDLGIEAELAEFLKNQEFPWAALGKTLTQFIEQFIGKIPKEKRKQGNISSQAYLENTDQIVLAEGASIEPFAFVAGPVYLGPGVTVRHGAYVRGSVFACKDAVIGHTSEVKGAILLPHAKAAHFAYVGDSILGVECNLGAGTKLANLRFDNKEVQLKVGTELINTKQRKFGAILGNKAQTGCNSVTNPGTILLPGAMVLPTSNARGIVKSRA